MREQLPYRRPRRRWLDHSGLLAVTALVAVGTGAGLALAATSGPAGSASAGSLSAATTPANSPAVSPGARRGCARIVTARRKGMLCRRSGSLRRTLHGSFAVPKAGGGTVTVDIQNGKVASVSQSSITLKSSDGFTKTYVVTGSTIVGARRDGIGSVKAGDQVWVTATSSGGTATAIRVRDLTQMQGDLGRAFGSRPAPASGSAAAVFGGPASG